MARLQMDSTLGDPGYGKRHTIRRSRSGTVTDYERPINRTKRKPTAPPKIGPVGGTVVAVVYVLLAFCVIGLTRLRDPWIFVGHTERLAFVGFFMLFGWMTLECLRMRQLNTWILFGCYCVYAVVTVALWPILGTPWPTAR